MKKLFCFILLAAILGPMFVSADVGEFNKPWCDTIPEEDRTGGIVPCGRDCNDPESEDYDESVPCQLCHLFVLIQRIINFLLLRIVPIIAVLMITIGGFMYILAYSSDTGGPGMLSKANQLFKSVLLGLLVVYGAYLLVGFFLFSVGLADWIGVTYSSWWERGVFLIECP